MNAEPAREARAGDSWRRAATERSMQRPGEHGRFADLLLIALLLLPNVVWVLADRRVWTSDAALYGMSSLRLHHALSVSPAAWWSVFLDTGPKPPILALIGGTVLAGVTRAERVDAVLLSLPLIAQCITLLLLFGATLRLTGSRVAAQLACVMVAAAPMFIDIGKQFYVQPVQFAVLAWFLFVMASADRWDRLFLVLQLSAASALALLTMLSSPLFMLVPGAVAVAGITRPNRPAVRPRVGLVAIGTAAVALGILTAYWYEARLAEALAYAKYSFAYAFGGVSSADYLDRTWIWLSIVGRGLLTPGAAIGMLLLWAVALRFRPSRGAHTLPARLLLVACAPLLIIAVLARAVLQEPRYVLPLYGYMAVALAWWLVATNRQRLARVATGIFGVQWLALQLAAFGVLAIGYQPVRPLLGAPDPRLDEVRRVVQLGAGTSRRVLTALGPRDIYSLQLDYHAAKQPGYFDGARPEFRCVEFVLTDAAVGGRVERAWEEIERWSPDLVIVLADSLRLAERDTWSASTHGWRQIMLGALTLSDRVDRSPEFERIDDRFLPAFAVYRAKDP